MADMISRQQAVDEVRMMAFSFAELYFAFVQDLRKEFGEEHALKIARRVLFNRAKERAEAMILRAEKEGLERIPENIHATSDVAYLGWDLCLGRDHCPYGTAWNRRIEEHPWFRKFAALYCDVTDTTIAEVFTGNCSHRLYENVVLGDAHCLRRYYPDEKVQMGVYTYALEEEA